MSFIALDLDGVVSPISCHYKTTCDSKIAQDIEQNVRNIYNLAESYNIPVIINTARPSANLNGIPDNLIQHFKSYEPVPIYDDTPDATTNNLWHCYQPREENLKTVPEKKQICMQSYGNGGILFEDNLENCLLVRKHGNKCIHIDPSKYEGVSDIHVKELEQILRDGKSI